MISVAGRHRSSSADSKAAKARCVSKECVADTAEGTTARLMAATASQGEDSSSALPTLQSLISRNAVGRTAGEHLKQQEGCVIHVPGNTL